MTLGELIEFLEKQDQALTLPEGFANPHSYRGYYDELAFEPAQGVTVASMLDAARFALGDTFYGWKGGEYVMNEYTSCWLAVHGDTGEGLGPQMLRLMIAAGRKPDSGQAAYESPWTADEKAAYRQWLQAQDYPPSMGGVFGGGDLLDAFVGGMRAAATAEAAVHPFTAECDGFHPAGQQCNLPAREADDPAERADVLRQRREMAREAGDDSPGSDQ